MPTTSLADETREAQPAMAGSANPATPGVTILFDEQRIAQRVEELARSVAGALDEEFVIVGLLKGSFVFVADFVRALDRIGVQPEVEFMRVASYGRGKESSGTVQLIGGMPDAVDGRTVLLVDDIIDTGRSLAYTRDLLLEHGAAKVWTCTLLDKPSRREVEVPVDFVGFAIEDIFVVGYGIDYAERYRHLPYIGAVE